MPEMRDSDGFPIPTSAHQVEILARAFRIEARVAQHIRNWEDLKSELEGRLLLGSKATEDRNRRTRLVMESVVIDMCEDIVDDEELDLATRGGRLTRDPTPPEEKHPKTGKGEVEVVNGRNPALQDMADKLAEFFESPRLCKNDYVDDFLMFLGKPCECEVCIESEDIDARLPMGQILNFKNVNTKPSWVIHHCLWKIFEDLKVRIPGYTERRLRDYINWFLTHEEGYIHNRIAEIAKSKYCGKVIPDDL